MKPFVAVLGIVLLVIEQGAAQRVFLSSNNPTPCFGDTVDFICYYPDVMERVEGNFKYTTAVAIWRVNRERLFPGEDSFNLRPINLTASKLRVRIDPANFTGDPISFTCFLPLTGGGEDSASTVVDPQESATPPVVGGPVLVGNTVLLQWDHTDKGPCFNNLTFSYNITWYPVVGRTGQTDAAKSAVASNSEDTKWFVLTNLLPNTSYQVEIVGFTSTSPQVYSEPADVRVGFAIQGNTVVPRSDQDCSGCCDGNNNVNICTVALVPLSVVIVVTMGLSMLVNVALCVRIHYFKKQVKVLMPNKEGDVEMETNPSYMVVVPAVQWEGGRRVERSGKPQYINVGLVD